MLRSDIILCLACRSEVRAHEAKQKLKNNRPDAIIDIVLLDTSSVFSVQTAAQELKNR